MKESKQMKKNIKKFYKIVVKEHNYIKWRNDLYEEYSDVEVYSNIEIINEYKYCCTQSKFKKNRNNLNLFQYFTILSTIFLSFLTLLINISIQNFTNSFAVAEKNIELEKKTIDVVKSMSELSKIGNETFKNFSIILRNGLAALIVLSLFAYFTQLRIDFCREKESVCNNEILFILEDVLKERGIKKVKT